MAELPPKVPNITQNLPSFPHKRLPSTIPNITPANNAQQSLSWVDEFLHFSSARRGAHRQSASDSIAFLETPILEECPNSAAAIMSGGAHRFAQLDDDQLMSMFTDDIVFVALPPPALSYSSTPNSSEQNSSNDEKPMTWDVPLQGNNNNIEKQQQPKAEPEEVDSSCNETPAPLPSTTTPSGGETIVDPKRVKRILANRQSAQRSRVRKLQYISELERSITTLQMEISALSPRVAFFDQQRLILNVDNGVLKERIAALAQDKIFKDAHQEALKKEIERLRQVYHQQNLHKMGNSVSNNGHSLHSSPSSQPQKTTVATAPLPPLAAGTVSAIKMYGL